MVNKIPFSVSDDTNKSTEVIIADATQSISSYASSSSSLGFGDFENGTIYDRIAELDAPINDLINESFYPRDGVNGSGVTLDKAVVQNSTGIVFGNSVTITGTLIIDGSVAKKTTDELEGDKIIETETVTNENELENQVKDSLNVDAIEESTNVKPQRSRIRRKIIIAVVILCISLVVGVVTVVLTHFISF